MIVTRIAPSPTGKFLHLGNLRTLLYNYFLAKKHGGKFYVRLEDTDRDRYTPSFLQYFQDTLNWLGIKPDASFWNPDPNIGSFIQSERDYSDKIKYLLDNGFAYYAFDSKEDLDNAHKLNTQFKYDASTRMSMKNSLSLDENTVNDLLKTTPYVIRFKVPSNIDILFTDAILGDISINTNQVDDKVLVKSNGIGSYHLCNVCDDHDMGVTHVLRGQEWIASTPFHILLYKAFNWNIPTFAHLPLIMNPDGKGKLSKRTASKYGIPIAPIGYTDSGKYHQGWNDLGYEPDAFMNALALVGWNPGNDKEILSMKEMINSFSLDRVHKAGARFDMAKATWINSQWIQHMIPNDDLITLNLSISEDQKLALINEAKKRCNFKGDIKSVIDTLFERKSKTKIENSDIEIIYGIIDTLNKINNWTFDNISDSLTNYINTNNLKSGKTLGLLRKTLLYNSQGIDVKTSLFVLGKTESIERLEAYTISEII